MRLIVSMLLCCVATIAQAASIHVERLSSGYSLVTIEGDLAANDGEEFKNKVKSLSGVTVIFNSDGGDLAAGMHIGRTIRRRQFETWIPNDFRCASACALAWLASARRLIGRSAVLGFQASAKSSNEPGADHVAIGQYLADLGFSPDTIARVSKFPDAMTWMNAKEAERWGIRLVVLDTHLRTSRRDVATHSQEPRAMQPRPMQPMSRPPRSVQPNQAGAFVVKLYAAVSGPNSEALRVLGGAYAETVDYFGKRMSRNQVLAYYSRLLERWPQRLYKPRDNSMDHQCDGSTCTAKGMLDFDAASPTRNERFVGRAKFEFVLEFELPDAVPVIVKETGTLVERRVQRLREPSGDPGKRR